MWWLAEFDELWVVIVVGRFAVGFWVCWVCAGWDAGFCGGGWDGDCLDVSGVVEVVGGDEFS